MARKAKKLPYVMTEEELQALLSQLKDHLCSN